MIKGRTNNHFRTIRLFEAFAGIGSQYKALKNISHRKKWNISHVGMVEWYLDAIIGYIAIHDKHFKPTIEKLDQFIPISKDSKTLITNNSFQKINNSYFASYINHSKNYFNNIFDIRNVNASNFPKNIDIFTYSFPCQDLSVQGLQKGINKEDKTRSGLLWEVERILNEIVHSFKEDELPKYLLMENVKNLIGKKNLANYKLWFNELEKLGYVSKTYLLNSKNFGSSQNRERVFCLSIRKEYMQKIGFKFQELEQTKKSEKVLKNVIQISENNKYLSLSNYSTTTFKKTKNGVISKKLINYTNFNSENYIYDLNGLGPTLTASGANSRLKIQIDNNVRYMTAHEATIYMGFDSNDYFLMSNTKLISDNKIIYLCGNSISVQVLEAIFDSMRFDN